MQIADIPEQSRKIHHRIIAWLFMHLGLYITGYALGIWICGFSLFYKRELWASKSAGAHRTKSLIISGCKR